MTDKEEHKLDGDFEDKTKKLDPSVAGQLDTQDGESPAPDDTVIMLAGSGAGEVGAPASPGEAPGLDTTEVPADFSTANEAADGGLTSVGFITEALPTKSVATVGFATEGLPAERLATEGIGTEDVGLGRVPTETEGMAMDFAAADGGVVAGLSDDDDNPDEVLVLLDDESDEIPTDSASRGVSGETSQGGDLDGAWDSGDGDSSGFTREIGMTPQNIEDIGLRSVNPLDGEDGLNSADLDGSTHGHGGTSGAGSQPVGVIDEIAELATSLDPDILGAGEESGGEFDDGHDDEFDGDEVDEFGSFEDDGRGRDSSRTKVFLAVGSIAAVLVVGFFVFASLRDGTSTAVETGVATAQTDGSVSSNPIGTGEVIGGGEESGDATGVASTTGDLEVGVDHLDPVESTVSPTRKTVRQIVLLAMELGLQWQESKE